MPPTPVGGTSKIGTMNPMDKSRVYTDEFLKPVAAGSADAAFVFKKGDLERLQDRRKELGLDKNDDALRAQLESQKAALAAEKRKEVEAKDRVATLEAALANMQKQFDALAAGKALGKAEAEASTEATPETKSGKAAK